LALFLVPVIVQGQNKRPRSAPFASILDNQKTTPSLGLDPLFSLFVKCLYAPLNRRGRQSQETEAEAEPPADKKKEDNRFNYLR
jgi:hypothetical protein